MHDGEKFESNPDVGHQEGTRVLEKLEKKISINISG